MREAASQELRAASEAIVKRTCLASSVMKASASSSSARDQSVLRSSSTPVSSPARKRRRMSTWGQVHRVLFCSQSAANMRLPSAS